MRWKWIFCSVAAAALALWVGLLSGDRGVDKERRLEVVPRGCIAVGLSQSLLVVTADGAAVVDFLEFGSRNALTTYRWRYRAFGGPAEESGSGQVDEKLDSHRRTITAGAVSLKWSYGSREHGWVYYSPATAHYIAICDDGQFTTIGLSGLFSCH